MKIHTCEKNKWLLKLNMVFILFMVICSMNHNVAFGATKSSLKGGLVKYPVIIGDNIELLLWAENYEDPQFEILLLKSNGEQINLIKEIEIFEEIDGAYYLKFYRNFKQDDSQIQIILTDNEDSNKINRMNINIQAEIGEIAHRTYGISSKRSEDIEKIYDRNGKVKSEDIPQDLLKYINDSEYYVEDTVRFKSFGNELYKLHIYDVSRNQWIIDKGDYRKHVEFKPDKSGKYILDLWIKSDISDREYDRWMIKPVLIKDSKIIKKKEVIVGNMPMYANDFLTFYLKTDIEEMVQYKVWIIDENDGSKKLRKITDEYTQFVPGNQFFKIKSDMKLKTGRYKLWFWVRKLGDNNYFTSSGGWNFFVQPEEEGIERYYGGDLLTYPEKEFFVDEKISIYGVDFLETPFNDFLYKSYISKVEGGAYIRNSGEYADYLEWIPKESGQYILNISMMDKNNHNKGEDDEFVQKIEVIEVKDRNKSQREQRKFTIVNDFDELYNAVENDYVMVIANEKVREAYERLIGVIDDITTSEMTDLEKLVNINQFIVANTEYDSRILSGEDIDIDSTNMYGVLINNRAICQGYADTTKVFLDILGIPNRMITGSVKIKDDSTISHIWNVVNLNGREYHLDTTYNDPIDDTKSKDAVSYDRFLVSDRVMETSHLWDKEKFGEIDNEEFIYFSFMKRINRFEDWIYYISKKDRDRLYKVRIDGTEKTKISNNRINEFDLNEEWIVFTVIQGGHIYRVNKEGLGPLKLNNEPSINIKIHGEWIIYTNRFNNKMYKVGIDGKEKLPYKAYENK